MMSEPKLPEVWLRGPIEGIPPMLQPVAHALLQAKEEIHELVNNFPPGLLWEQPAGSASVGFHLQHITGVLDRLFTYAMGNLLSAAQLEYLKQEGKPATNTDSKTLLQALDEQVETSLSRLKAIDPGKLTETRGVGRKQIPSTLLGLLFHAAEHTMRHTGQLLVTVRIVKSYNSQ